MRRAGKSRGFTAAALLFGVCFFLTLGMVIMPAATSEQERQSAQVHPTIEAEITRAFTGESMDVTVHAKVPEHEPFRVFTLLAESDRAGLSGLLTFDDRGIAVIQDEAGNPIELHRTLREGEENELDYWFVLYGGQETVFTLSVEDQLDIGELRRETEAAERNRERQAAAEAMETTAPGEMQPAQPASPSNASGSVTTSSPAATSAPAGAAASSGSSTSSVSPTAPSALSGSEDRAAHASIASPSNARRAEKPAASKTIERPAAASGSNAGTAAAGTASAGTTTARTSSAGTTVSRGAAGTGAARTTSSRTTSTASNAAKKGTDQKSKDAAGVFYDEDGYLMDGPLINDLPENEREEEDWSAVVATLKLSAGSGQSLEQAVRDAEKSAEKRGDAMRSFFWEEDPEGVLHTRAGSLRYENGGISVELVYPEEAGIPAGSLLSCAEIQPDSQEYALLVADTEEALAGVPNAGVLSSARFFDISITYLGETVEPLASVQVMIRDQAGPLHKPLNRNEEGQSAGVESAATTTAAANTEPAEVSAVHFGEEGTELLPAEAVARDLTGAEGVRFDAERFSVYGVVQTVKEQILEASDGKNYKVTVVYDTTSGIPADVELLVSELNENSPYFTDYIEKTAETLGEEVEKLAFAHVFDISLVDIETGEKYQPNKDVKVKIELLSEDVKDGDELSVVHFRGDVTGEAGNQGENGENINGRTDNQDGTYTEKPYDINGETGVTEVLECNVNGEAVEFETDGFSVYVITGSDGFPRCTYTFHVWSDEINNYTDYPVTNTSGNNVYSQTVKSVDELVVPQFTSTDDKTFAGWYEGTIESGVVILSPTAYDFDTATIAQDGDSAISLYAVFKEYANVYFHGQYDSTSKTFPVSSTVRTELVTTTEGETTTKSATVDISDVTTSYSSTGSTKMDFIGWSYTPVQTPGVLEDSEGNSYIIPTGSITISEETHLYPIYKSIHWLTYYAAQSGLSASYVAPASFYAGDPVEYNGIYSLPVTSRDGYTFQGWWTGTLSKNGSTETVNYGTQITNADGSLVTTADEGGVYISGGKLYLSADATLYAKWQATYNIVIWRQKTTDSLGLADENKNYEYAETITLPANIGDIVTVADDYKNYGGSGDYTGYTFGHCDGSKTIENTKVLTVLNVYYDLSTAYTPTEGGSYTLTFADSVTGSDASPMPSAVTNLSYGTSLADSVPQNPTSSRISDSGKAIYKFDRWYADETATIPVFFSTPTEEDTESLDDYVVYDTMPDHNVTVYAGWEPIKFKVDIDPNYGALYYYDSNGDLQGSGATYFNNTYDAEPIGEYTHAARDYVESTSGTYFYVNHDRAYGGADCYTYYTTKQSEATEDTTFEYSPGIYNYAGWYEVYSDGSEASAPYDFSQHTDHATTLRLHWKKSGAYYLKYNAVVDGLSGTMDDTDASAELFADGNYADYAEITLTHSAIAPNGYTFVGWKARGSDSTTIYRTGQNFILHADDAIRTSGKEVVFLDAVYARVDTASITYDANGGTINGDNVDFGSIPETSGTTEATGEVDSDSQSATVSGLVNNSRFMLSDGTGFSYSYSRNNLTYYYTLKGWSNKAVYDPDDSDAELYSLGGTYGVDSKEPTTLYAVWHTTVTYHLNKEQLGEEAVDWSSSGTWGDPYTKVTNGSESVYFQDIYIGNERTYNSETGTYTNTAIGNPVTEPSEVNASYIPIYTGSNNKLFRYWATKSTGGGTDTYTEYGFTQDVTGALDLYAYWSEPNNITVHAVDASTTALSEITSERADYADWTINPVTVGTTSIALPGSGYVTTPSDYEIAFVAAHDSSKNVNTITKEEAVSAIAYDAAKKGIYVTYQDGHSAKLQDRVELYYVCYQKKNLSIVYRSMAASGVLSDVNAAEAAITTGSLGTYDMQNQITTPLSLVSGFSYYAFAIGSASAADASAMSVMTDPSDSDNSRPALQIRNTWKGFEYSEDGDNWVSCGYDPTLYVIYFEQKPTTIIFKEKTVGSSSIMDTEFTYNVTVTQMVTDGSGNKITTTLFDTTSASEGESYHGEPYNLKNGEEQSAILFYDVNTTQTITITQTLNDDFDAVMASEAGTATQPNVWTYTSDGSGGTQTVTFTNTHKALPVEVHVAMVENDGVNGGIIRRDSTLRSTTEANYQFDLALGTSETLLTKLPSSAVFTGDTTTYAFGAVMSGTGTENSTITVGNMGIASVAYEKISDNDYELVLKDSDGNTISELGSNQLYYLYYPMPKIRYVKETADGTLTNITGCLEDTTTGSIVERDSVTYSHALLTMNGKTVEQNESFEIPLSGFVISQSGNNFRMPPVLDDGLYERYLSYVKLGAGSGDATNSADLDVSTGLTMQLKVQNNTLQYSFDGTTWKDLPLSGTPTIYAIYTERGYDFQISKTVDTSESGENAIFSDAGFTVTITSTAITKDSYDAEGAESATVTATPADGTTPGTITLTVVDGTKVRIKGLGRGNYTVTESGNENYILTARTGPIVGSSTSPMTVTDNITVSFTLDTEKKVDLTNSPKAICKIDDHYFYTLRSMVEYVDSEIATKTATAEMLTDYLMPAADTVEIPNGCDITLTTAKSVGRVAVITRTDDLADVSLFTNNGTLTIANLTLEGSSVVATAPMIQSAGDLTVGSGATIQNVVGGGAINAIAGNITVSGTIQKCSAAEGGAIHHSGNSTITLNGTGTIQNNTATTYNGGAIYLAGGTVKVSGTSKITGNKAESGNGGAVYCPGTVVIELDQGGSVTNNTAKEGGAIYAETGAISISKTAENVSPALTGNTATTGNGGAIHVGTGSVSVSGGSVSSNKAENGLGGAIYANAASVTVSGTAEVKSNNAKEGGAVYAVSGAVEVSGGAVDNNTASTGNGGAIYAGSGHVTLSGGSVSGNRATAGSGGAVYAGIGNVTVSGGSMTNNTAKTDGGAVCANSGSITVSVPDGGTAETIQGNSATTGKGGALYADSGAVSITGTTLTGNTAGSDGGAVYAGTGAVTLTDSVFGGATATDGNTAGGSGGAIYAGIGNVTVSGGSMTNNTAKTDGGALYAGSGAATMSTVTLSGNSAATGKGGTVYLDSGSLTLTTVTAAGNSAINGAAVFVNIGRANFSAGSYTGNVASEGGAVGVGSKDARLYFTGDVQVKDNKLGTGDDAPKSNVYLDQDDDAIINIDTLGGDAAIGIYVADSVENTRGVPGARFAVYTSNSNVNKITNDRYTSLTVQSDTAAKKLYWGNSVKVEVMYHASYASGLPNGTSSGRGTSVKEISTYYPTLNDEGKVALSELAADVYTKNSDLVGKNGFTATAAYGGAFYYDAPDYGNDITWLVWNKQQEKWQLEMRNAQTVDLPGRIYLIYTEPAYVSIENNTDMSLKISDLQMTVNGSTTSVINSSTSTGYGMVFAKNGAIRTALLPITADDLKLAAGQSVNLLIPGGQNMAYALDGSFETTTGGSVRLRRGAETSLSEETVTVSATDGTFEQLIGTTLNAAGTYNIIFGSNKIICKVVDASGVEHPYSKISSAIADIVATTGANPPYTLTTAKTATIEMVTDYLLPASDHVLIPRGYDITLTTAAPEGTERVTYTYHGESADGRAIISRDSENKYSMIDAWNSAWNVNTGTGTDNVNALDNTVLKISKLVLDGKSVRGESDGGAVASKYVNVYIDTVDFKNVYASNGGAMLIMFSAKDKNNKDTVPDTLLDVKNSNFTGCTSWTTETSNRLGGGAIVTNAETMTLKDCDFTNCTAVDQAGAVFHRVDKNNNSWTTVTGCTFTNCSARAAGGLELDSKTITVTGCTFNHCQATERNGGGFNVWALNSGTSSADCWVTVTDCVFNDCQVTDTKSNGGNGGGFRSTSVYTVVKGCTFTNNTGYYGGGFCVSNTNAKKAEIYGCTFYRNTANQGGGILVKAKEIIVGDYTYTDSSGEHTRHTEIKNCTSKQEGGGGIRHDRDVNGSSLSITNAVISGNAAQSSSKNGGGVFTNARTVTIAGSTITDNTCTNKGGGVYAYSYTSMTITDSDISRNIASSDGGGVWFDANNDTNRALQVLTIKGSTIDGNTSNGNGGGVYTLGKTVTIGASDTKTDSNGKYIRSSISNNSAKNGGGVYQSRNVAGSKLEISDTSISGNAANGGTGGGVYAGVRTLTVTSTEISRNSATSDGGGIWYEINNDDARKAMKLTVEGCTLDTNTSGGKGGGIYTLAKTVEIKEHTEGTGEDAVTTPTTISNCTASASGGGFYHNKRYDGTSLTIENSKITGCTANDTATNNVEHGGGGIFGAFDAITIVGSEISNNSAVRNGGGINAHLESNNYSLIIDNTKIVGNSSGNLGGGIYTRSQLTLRNGTEITGNRLTTNTAANCAGVYLNNNRTLFVGSEGAATDTIIVRGNTTANGTLSDLRLWDNGSENNSSSVHVYCSLSPESEIRVVNAAKARTWFGSAALAYPGGFSDEYAAFRADSSSLRGIIDRTDPDRKKIIWAGPPVAKITDGEGTLLYLKASADGAVYPAVFDRLDTGNSSEGSTVSPFSLFRLDEPVLYYKDGTPCTGPEYCVKMLTEQYETAVDISLQYREGRTVTFTTADASDEEYPFEGKAGGRATVIRAASVSSGRSLMNVSGNLILENIVIDGGAENGITPGGSTRCIWIDEPSCTVTLGENAILQNGRTTGDGGGLYINRGAVRISGGVIRSCAARDGGAVYKKSAQELTITAGSISQCTATGKGGAVYNLGSSGTGGLVMEGGTISGCTADRGGAVYVVSNRGIPFTMKGGSITGNRAFSSGGGIAVEGANSRLYFSGKVTVSGNTCDTSVAAERACNVELNQASYEVINTSGGGLSAGSYIGVYVDGEEGTGSRYDHYGVERKPFGTFASGDSTANFYSFVNDRNGLKGGIIEETDPNYQRGKNCIYWIQIFSLSVRKEVVFGASTEEEPDDSFFFRVTIRGKATVTGQADAKDIDSGSGEYGEMRFTSNGTDTATAFFELEDGESITGVNLSEGLTYEVTEYLTREQFETFAAMPMNGYHRESETLTVDGRTYSLIRANSYTGTIGENKARRDVDPYTSALTFTNLMPVCKITDNSGKLLYQKYIWNEETFYAPAVFTELTGDDGALKALEEEMLYTSNSSYPTSWNVSNGVQIKMLIGEYSLTEAAEVHARKVTLTTASTSDSLFPKQDAGTTSTILRAFGEGSMLEVTGDLTLGTIILDGAKDSGEAAANGGIANVAEGGRLTIQSGAYLQNSAVAETFSGGAVYAASGGTVAVTGGTIRRNEAAGSGAGIFLEEGSTLYLSGSPDFGGTGLDIGGNLTGVDGNFRRGSLVAQTNGGRSYERARQDIFIAESEEDPASVVLDGKLNAAAGSIWVWADDEKHYAMTKPFARIRAGAVNEAAYAAFRNAQPDSVTGCGGDQYLSGSRGEQASFIYWSGGFDVSFRKIDGFGRALPGAVFTLYTDEACSSALQKNGADVTAVSADGTAAYRDRTGAALGAGTVRFEQIPAGVYYMKETGTPEGYLGARAEDGSGGPAGSTYIVLAGDAAMQEAGTGALADITPAEIEAQTGTGDGRKDAAVFLIDPETQIASATPDIAARGIMNISADGRRTILRKVSGTYAPLEGAEFEILRYDRTRVSGTDAGGAETAVFTSGANGVYFVGQLPFGTYYLHETGYPDGAQQNGGDGWWYTLTVSSEGITCTEQQETEPDDAVIQDAATQP